MYRVTEVGLTADLNEVAVKYRSKWQNTAQNMQSVLLTVEQVLVANLTNGIDIGADGGAVSAGQVGGDCMPSFVTWSFQQTRSTAITRHGHKLVGGIPETSVSNGVSTFSPLLFADWEECFVAPLATAGAVPPSENFSMEAVIVGRTLNPLPTPHYEIDLSKINPIQGLIYRGVSTANTRKIGSGV
jgi:hypothetical protein